MHKNNSFAKNTVILFLSMIFTKLIGAVLKIPLMNLLGGMGMGYYASAFSIFSPVYAVLSAGIPTIVTKLVAQNAARRCYKSIRNIKRCALLMSALAGISGSVFICLFSKSFAENFASSPESFYAIIAIAPSVLFCCVAAVYKGYFEGLSDMLPTGISQIVEAVVKAALGLSFAYLALWYNIKNGLTVEEAVPFAAAASVVGISVGEFFGTLYLMIRYKHRSDGISESELNDSPRPPRMRETMKSIIKASLPISLGAATGSLSPFIDMLTMPVGITETALQNQSYFIDRYGTTDFSQFGTFVYGSYTGIVLTLFMLITSITAIIGKSAFPKISACNKAGNKTELNYNIKILFSGICTVGFPLCFLLGFFSKNILQFLYPDKLLEISVCSESLSIICFGGIFIALTGGLFVIFQAIGKAHIQVKLIMLSVVIKLIGNLILTKIPETSVNASAIASITAFIIIAVTGFVLLKKALKNTIKITEYAVKPFTAALISTVSGVFVMYCVACTGNTVTLFISGTVSCVLYICLLAIFDRKSFLSIKKRFTKKARFGSI